MCKWTGYTSDGAEYRCIKSDGHKEACWIVEAKERK